MFTNNDIKDSLGYHYISLVNSQYIYTGPPKKIACCAAAATSS